MAHDINAALERLEKNLTDLDSARLQVLNAVNANNELLKMVTLYVSSVRNLATRLQEWSDSLNTRESILGKEIESAISNIDTSCSAIIETFTSAVNESSSDFKDKTEVQITAFTAQNTKFAEKVNELNTLRDQIKTATDEINKVKTNLEDISKELKESQDEQDAELAEIKTMLNALPSTIQNGISSISTAISTSESVLTAALTQIDGKVNSINGKADTLATNIANLASLCQSINSSVSSSANNLTSAMNETKSEIIKASTLNRWLIIAAFIILAILQLVLKQCVMSHAAIQT